MQLSPSELTSARLLAATEDLELIAATVVEGFLHGLHQSPYVGFSVEFASHREYMPGDELRHVNWRLYGRHERLFVKEFDAETNLELHLIVDASGSMAGDDKWSCVAILAACLAHLAARQRDAVGLTLFAEEVLDHLRPKATSDNTMELLHMLASTREHPPANSARVLHEIAEMVPRRGLKVLISDFYYDLQELSDVFVHYRHAGHEFIVFHALTPLETGLPLTGSIRFRDSETGEEIVADAESIREEYTQVVEQWKQGLQKLCAQHGIDYVPVSSDRPLPEVLREYFRVRATLM